ncbi:MAG: 16S rRNA (uracil(1498)-N(3))-methyltransferase [Oscillatoria sp. PMC 1068.18]|nr:16S rRNA (uracil(1498)-N(3))-methyltransferase [Oscillatoria sp. PMC 1076.18]MEC4987304.1 16S rRNA (uracil(1498)-N(3))-methyltransferase [Oscillatoria sp. PMC 1068.18]
MQRLVINSTQRENNQIALTNEQLHYLKRVLRLGEGDRFLAMDGEGKSWLVAIAADSAIILEELLSQTELSVNCTLLVALPKGNGFDEIVRCSTELGVSKIIPVNSDRTLLKPSPNKLLRWRRIATEAAEQSERQFVPKISQPLDFATAVKVVAEENTPRYLSVARGNNPHLLHCLLDQKATQIVIATGPEGGWTPTEIELAKTAGFQPVSLGRRILRAITAPVFAISLVAAHSESKILDEREKL